MKVKKTVEVKGLTNQILIAWMVSKWVYFELGLNNHAMTSGSGGRHSYGSLHFNGNAIDIRSKDNEGVYFTKSFGDKVAETIASRLPNDYDIIFETNHIHMEWQPKK